MSYKLVSLREKILYVPQNICLLPCSIQENLIIGNQQNEERWNELIKQAFMNKLIEDGLDTLVLENATNLSGGDKQKIILGRIFMQNPDVIILDESFNAIDEETGENLFEILKKMYADKIIIIISHSLKYIDKCKKKIIIQDKKLIQQDYV